MKKGKYLKNPVIESLEQRVLFSADVPFADIDSGDEKTLAGASALSWPDLAVSNDAAAPPPAPAPPPPEPADTLSGDDRLAKESSVENASNSADSKSGTGTDPANALSGVPSVIPSVEPTGNDQAEEVDIHPTVALLNQSEYALPLAELEYYASRPGESAEDIASPAVDSS